MFQLGGECDHLLVKNRELCTCVGLPQLDVQCDLYGGHAVHRRYHPSTIGQLSQHSLPTVRHSSRRTCGPSHPTAHDLPTVLPTPQPTNLPTDLATGLLTVPATPSPTCRRR